MMCLAQALVNHDICHQTSTTEDVFFFHLPWAFDSEGGKLGSRSPFLPQPTVGISLGSGTLEMCCGSEELSYFSWVASEFRGHFVPVFPQTVVETQKSSVAGLYTWCSWDFASPQGSVQRLHFPKNAPFAHQGLSWLWQ